MRTAICLSSTPCTESAFVWMCILYIPLTTFFGKEILLLKIVSTFRAYILIGPLLSAAKIRIRTFLILFHLR